MQKRIFLLVFMLSAFSIALSVAAETPLIGFIAQDTTWTQANSPYVTLGNIIVKEGVTLTIEPGVTVQFDSGHSLTIEGVLIARGTDKQGIKFTPKGEKKPGAWVGILFEDSSIDAKFDDADNYVSGSILQYCTVEFAQTSVKANSASPFIDHCVISNNAGRGISVSLPKGDTIIIRNNIIADNHGGIVFFGDGTAIISGNTLTKNMARDGGGISISLGGTAIISNNTLTGNAVSSYAGDSYGGGIYVHGTATISGNTLSGNTVRAGTGDSCGGGIYITGIANINNNILIGNLVGGYNNKGGGIYVESGTVTINGNILAGNVAKSQHDAIGGGIYVESGAVTISNNTLSGNAAIYFRGLGGNAMGGGIYVSSGNVIITGNTITKNYTSEIDGAANGAAIYYSGSQNITGNFIANNVAEGSRNTNTVYINGNPNFTENTIIGNQTKYNLYHAQGKDSPNLKATNNYWGVTTEGEIRVKIYDVFADSSKAIVDVAPFLTEEPALSVPMPSGSLKVVGSIDTTTDGTSTANIITTLNDLAGKPITDEEIILLVSPNPGIISNMTNNRDGTYSVTYTYSGCDPLWILVPRRHLAVELVTFTSYFYEKIPFSMSHRKIEDKKVIVPADGQWHKMPWKYPSIGNKIYYDISRSGLLIQDASDSEGKTACKPYTSKQQMQLIANNENDVGKNVWIRIW